MVDIPGRDREPIFEARKIRKTFGPTVALDGVDLDVCRGEITGLIGENGSGKSTLASIAAGIQPANSGQMFFLGKPHKPDTMIEGAQAGIGMIVQEMGTVPGITVAENIFVGEENKFKQFGLISRRRMNRAAREALQAIGFDVDPTQTIDRLNMQDRKLVELAKTMYRQPYITLLALIILIVLVVLLNFTKFGFDTNSLRGGQAIAVSIGVNEKKNTVICYLIAGALTAAAGIINLSILGSCTPKLGLSSSSYMMNAFLPMFIGTFLAKYSERNIGIMVGSFAQACIISGFAILGLSTSIQLVLNGVIVLVFLVFTSNSYKIVEFQMLKQKRLKAQLTAEKAG
jgi:ABC-type lipoprotein export system ATPase subunit